MGQGIHYTLFIWTRMLAVRYGKQGEGGGRGMVNVFPAAGP